MVPEMQNYGPTYVRFNWKQFEKSRHPRIQMDATEPRTIAREDNR